MTGRAPLALIDGPSVVDRRPGLDCRLGRTKAIHYRGPTDVSSSSRPLGSADPSGGGGGILQAEVRERRGHSAGRTPKEPLEFANRARNAPALRQAPPPFPLTAERLPSHDTRTGRGTQTRGDGRDAHKRGVGMGSAARTARGAARALPSARNILEVIGVCPDEPQDLLSSQSGRGAKFERAKKEKAGPFWDREPLYSVLTKREHLLLFAFRFAVAPSLPPPLALEIPVHLGSRVGGCLKIMP